MFFLLYHLPEDQPNFQKDPLVVKEWLPQFRASNPHPKTQQYLVERGDIVCVSHYENQENNLSQNPPPDFFSQLIGQDDTTCPHLCYSLVREGLWSQLTR